MGNSASADEKSKAAKELLTAILNNDIPRIQHHLLANPKLFTAPLDLDNGHNSIHIAVLVKNISVLNHLLAYTGISRSGIICECPCVALLM